MMDEDIEFEVEKTDDDFIRVEMDSVRIAVKKEEVQGYATFVTGLCNKVGMPLKPFYEVQDILEQMKIKAEE